MASATFTSELMTNYVAAVPVSSGGHFATCIDSISGSVSVFGLSNDDFPQLELVVKNVNNVRVAVNFSNILGLEKSRAVHAFDVQQGSDLFIYMVIAVAVDGNEDSSQVMVLKPFKITSDLLEKKVQLEFIPVEPQTSSILQRLDVIRVGDPTGVGFPTVFAVNKTPSGQVNGEDVKQIDVLKYESWSVVNNLLPLNVTDVLDLTTATSVLGKGVFVLAMIQNKVTLIAALVRGTGDNQRISHYSFGNCPKDATCLASYLADGAGYNSLLVGCESGIYNFDAKVSQNGNGNPVLLTKDDPFLGINKLVVGRDESTLAIFANNTSGTLSYLKGTISELLAGKAAAIPLVAGGHSSGFSFAVSNPSENETWWNIMSVGKDSNLTLLRQNTDTGIWKSEMYNVIDTRAAHEIPSYSITVTCRDTTNGNPLSSGTVDLAVDSALPAIVNGHILSLSTQPTTVTLDPNGELHLISKTSAISTRGISITNVKDAAKKQLTMTEQSYDPSVKIIQRLGGIVDLRNEKTQSGKPVFDGNVSNDDLDSAVQCFSNLKTALSDLKHSSRIRSTGKWDDAWSNFHWFTGMATSAKEWFVEKLDGAWKFVCEIAGHTVEFVLDTVERIGQCADWVMTRLEVAWDKLCDWLGFLWDWDDIVQTKNTLKAFMQAGFQLASDKVDDFITKTINPTFDKILDKVENRVDHGEKITKSTTLNSTGASASPANSTAFKWVFERIQNGTPGTDMEGYRNPDTTLQPDASLINSVFGKMTSDLETFAQEVGSKLKSVSLTPDIVDTTSMWAQIREDVMPTVVDMFRAMTNALFSKLKGLIAQLIQLCTGSLHIPVLSALLNKYGATQQLDSGDSGDSFLDVVCFIVAVPSTVFTKMIVNRAPPTFNGLNEGLVSSFLGLPGSAIITNEQRLDFSLFTSGIVISVQAGKSCIDSLIALTKFVNNNRTGDVMPPNTIMFTILRILELIGAFSSVPHSDTPAYIVRLLMTGVAFFKPICDSLLVLTPLVADGGYDKALRIDLLVAIVNFGLCQAANGIEFTAESWKDYDQALSALRMCSSMADLIGAVGKFILTAGTTDPEVLADGWALTQVGILLKTFEDAITMKATYDRKKQHLISNSTF